MMTEPALTDSYENANIDSSKGELGSSIRVYDKKDLDIENETRASQTFFASQKADRPKEQTMEKPSINLSGGLSVYRLKDINRLITRKISPQVKKGLVDERNSLVDKKFKDGLSTKEERRLTYVRWQLDRIDDAEEGEVLDYFERIADQHENFAKEISTLLNRLNI